MANNLSRDAPLDLRDRYTTRPRPNRTSMNISVNNNFVQALPISPEPCDSPRQSAPGDYSHYLFAMGGMGESTGYPAVGVSRLVCGMAFGGTALAAVGMSAPAAAATCGDWPSYRTFVERFGRQFGRHAQFGGRR